MDKRQSVNISGIVTGEVKSGTSGAGTPYLRFHVRAKDGIYECVSFKDTAAAYAEKIKPDIHVDVRGHYKDNEAREERNLTVRLISLKTKEADSRDYIIEEFGSMTAYKSYLKELRTRYISQGKVLACELIEGQKVCRWHRVQDCIQDDSGVWWTKMDYLMNELGPEVVKTELWGCRPLKSSAKTVADMTGLQDLEYVKKVRDTVDGMLENARFVKERPQESYEFNYEE